MPEYFAAFVVENAHCACFARPRGECRSHRSMICSHAGRLGQHFLEGPEGIVQPHEAASKYSEILIDVGGRDTGSLRAALTVSDTILIPLSPEHRPVGGGIGRGARRRGP